MKMKRTYFDNKKQIRKDDIAKEEIGLFKPAVVKKASGLMALLMLVSILTPILAFAGSWFVDGSVKYMDDTVTGIVYTDESDESSVTINVYSPDDLANPIGSATKVVTTCPDGIGSSVTSAVYTCYSFSFKPGSNFDSLRVVTGDVYNVDVNRQVTQVTPPYFGGGGGGVTSGNEISIGSDGKVNASSLENALKTFSNVILNLSGDSAIIPASALLNADGKTIKVIANNSAAYTYPINIDLLNKWAAELNMDVKDLTLTISMKKVEGSALDSIQKAAQDMGATLLADPIDFKVTASSSNQSIDITDMGQYVQRSLPLTKKADAGKSTGVTYNPKSSAFSFVPSTFSSQDDHHLVNITRHSNSIYTVIEYARNFSDVITHWAKSDIELLTNKLIVNGMTAATFEPERDVTRAEFAALIVRSLGLSKEDGTSSFSDVHADDWFAAEVNAAAKAGIVDGYPDGTFKPDNKINREELAAMVVRALNFAGIDTKLTATEQLQTLSAFTDSSSIVWAHAEIAEAIHAEIVNGMTATTLAPRDDASRAQAVTMIKRFLTNAHFIN